jgi:hypothetical protein
MSEERRGREKRKREEEERRGGAKRRSEEEERRGGAKRRRNQEASSACLLCRDTRDAVLVRRHKRCRPNSHLSPTYSATIYLSHS